MLFEMSAMAPVHNALRARSHDIRHPSGVPIETRISISSLVKDDRQPLTMGLGQLRVPSGRQHVRSQQAGGNFGWSPSSSPNRDTDSCFIGVAMTKGATRARRDKYWSFILGGLA